VAQATTWTLQLSGMVHVVVNGPISVPARPVYVAIDIKETSDGLTLTEGDVVYKFQSMKRETSWPAVNTTVRLSPGALGG
jgi:hypothetical protein